MKRAVLPIIVPQACLSGECDLDGPAGRVSITVHQRSSVLDAGSSTMLELSYAGFTSVCAGPATTPEGNAVPFVCTLATSALASQHVLTLEPGCTRGLLREVEAGRVVRSLRIDTSDVEVAGLLAPANEASLSDELRVVAHTDRGPAGIELFAPPDRPTSAPELLALLSLHSFFQLEGTRQSGCVRGL